MLVSFFESIKYVGHFYPIAILRFYLGYYFFNTAYEHLDGEFLRQPRLAATIMDHLPTAVVPIWYSHFLQHVVVPNWQFFAYFLTYCEFIVGISFLIGFLVRPASLIGLIMTLNLIYAVGDSSGVNYQLFVILFIVMLWVGAGRCLGIDYFFYKRQRGLWW